MSAKYLIEYNSTGTTYVALKAQLSSEGIIDEKNVKEEAYIYLVNTTANRAIVAAKPTTRIKFDGTIIFTGILRPIEYSLSTIRCRIDNLAFATAHGKIITADYTAGEDADKIFGAICTACGLTAGVCPTTSMSLRFEKTDCFEAFKAVANALNLTLYSSGTTINIGTKGGTARTFTGDYGEGTRRKVDDTQNYTKIYVRSTDTDGTTIYGEAGTGNNIKVFTYANATDVATLNLVAAQKLAEYNRDSIGVPIKIPLSIASQWVSGDTLAVTNTALAMNGTYTIERITKNRVCATVEVDAAIPGFEKIFAPIVADEDFGIYLTPGITETEHAAIDHKGYGVLLSGVDASKPAAGSLGRIYWATDTHKYYMDTGTTWTLVGTESFSNLIGTVSGTQIADDAITVTKIADDAIEAPQIKANAVTAAKILANAVTTDKLDANAVTTAKLAANCVTTGILAANAVTADIIAANAITAAKVMAGEIIAEKIDVIGSWSIPVIATDVLRSSNDTSKNIAAGSYTKYKEIKVTNKFNAITGESFRIKFTLEHNDPFGGSSFGRIYKNGVALGTERQVNNGDGAVVFSEDFTTAFVADDLIQIYCYYTGGGSPITRAVSNMRLYYGPDGINCLRSVTNQDP